MKHATTAALDRLEPLLAKLRTIGELSERSRGVFYRKSRAFLHFHEDPAGLFANIRSIDSDDFDRMPADSAAAQDALVAIARARSRG